MATTTPNFGWPVPTSTDLVKDGATAMEALGDAIDTSMVDLKGGTTGQILSKASSSDMDFSWTTPNPGDITGVTAGTGISGGGTSGDVTITNSMATTITTKGDLVPGTGSGTFARLAVGNNGEVLVADSTTSTGLRYQQQNIKNYVYNSNFDIWQRGTSFANVSGYSADRWTNSGVFSGVTVSRQTSGAPVGSYYYVRNTSTGAGSYQTNYQYLETQDCEELWGKTVTFSVKMRRNSTVNNTGILLVVDKSSTVDAGAGATWTGISNVAVPISSIPTGTTSADWYTASVTATIPSDGTANSLRLVIGYNGGTANGSVYDISQVMLQVGSVVTAYQRMNTSIQGELAACQRYYYLSATGTNQAICNGYYYSAAEVDGVIQFPVTMRTTPTLDQVTGTDYYTFIRNGGGDGFNSFSLSYASPRAANIYNGSQVSGTSGQAGHIASNNASAYLAFSADL